MDAALVGPAAQRLFDAAMLVSERDFEMEDALAVTAEAKMPGFDDPGMHRADRDFMDLGAGNQPIDMIGYSKDGKDYLLMANSRFGIVKVPTAQFSALPG